MTDGSPINASNIKTNSQGADDGERDEREDELDDVMSEDFTNLLRVKLQVTISAILGKDQHSQMIVNYFNRLINYPTSRIRNLYLFNECMRPQCIDIITRLYADFQRTPYFTNEHTKDSDKTSDNTNDYQNEGEALRKCFGVLKVHGSSSKLQLAAELSKSLNEREMAIVNKLAFMQIIVHDDMYMAKFVTAQSVSQQQQQGGLGFRPITNPITNLLIGGTYVGILGAMYSLGVICASMCGHGDVFCMLRDMLFGTANTMSFLYGGAEGKGDGDDDKSPNPKLKITTDFLQTFALSIVHKQLDYQSTHGMDNRTANGLGICIVSMYTFLDIDTSFLANTLARRSDGLVDWVTTTKNVIAMSWKVTFAVARLAGKKIAKKTVNFVSRVVTLGLHTPKPEVIQPKAIKSPTEVVEAALESLRKIAGISTDGKNDAEYSLKNKPLLFDALKQYLANGCPVSQGYANYVTVKREGGEDKFYLQMGGRQRSESKRRAVVAIKGLPRTPKTMTLKDIVKGTVKDSVKDLRSLAKDAGIKGGSRMRKDELLRALGKTLGRSRTKVAKVGKVAKSKRPSPQKQGKI